MCQPALIRNCPSLSPEWEELNSTDDSAQTTQHRRLSTDFKDTDPQQGHISWKVENWWGEMKHCSLENTENLLPVREHNHKNWRKIYSWFPTWIPEHVGKNKFSFHEMSSDMYCLQMWSFWDPAVSKGPHRDRFPFNINYRYIFSLSSEVLLESDLWVWPPSRLSARAGAELVSCASCVLGWSLHGYRSHPTESQVSVWELRAESQQQSLTTSTEVTRN